MLNETFSVIFKQRALLLLLSRMKSVWQHTSQHAIDVIIILGSLVNPQFNTVQSSAPLPSVVVVWQEALESYLPFQSWSAALLLLTLDITIGDTCATKNTYNQKAPVQTSHMVSSWTSWREQKLVSHVWKITQKVSFSRGPKGRESSKLFFCKI